MNKKFIKILFFYLIIMVSANVIHPITPEFIKVRAFPDFMFGVALAMMNLTNFFFSNFWGNICDKVGRLKVIIIGCGGYAIGQLIFGFSQSIEVLILARLISGFFTGAFTVPIIAYISDISSQEELKKHLSIFVTSSALASALGYYLGGMIGTTSLINTFYFQVLLLVIAILCIVFFIKEERVFSNQLSINSIIQTLNPFQVFLKNKISSIIVLMLMISFFVYFGNTMYDNSFSFYLSKKLSMPPYVNGVIKAITSVTTLFLNLTIINYFSKRFKTTNLIKNILIICLVVLVFIIFSMNQQMFFILNLLFYIIFMCVIPLQQSLIMENIDENIRGSASGMINATRSIAGVAGSLIAGLIYGKLPKIDLPYATEEIVFPIIFSIVSLILSISMILYFNFKIRNGIMVKKGD